MIDIDVDGVVNAILKDESIYLNNCYYYGRLVLGNTNKDFDYVNRVKFYWKDGSKANLD